MHELARVGPRALERSHWVPGHFTASAFVLSPDSCELLLIYHGKLSRWLQPGGHFDAADASPEAAARREVREETGLDDLELARPGLFDVDIHPIPARREDPEHEHFDLRFLFRARSRALVAGDDAHAAKWVRLSEIESDASVMRAVAKI
jgi:8-oxo-dGTP pyrophosphatase MutT (NUDIX family)